MTHTRLHHLPEQRAAQAPDAVFLHLQDGGTLSYAALQSMTAAAAQDLFDAGVQPTDRVLLVAENCPEHIALIMACSRLGAWSCGVNTRMSPGKIDAIARHTDVRLCRFTSGASAAARSHAQRWGAVPSALPGVVLSTARRAAALEPDPALADAAAIIFTSGTSGTPKGVVVWHRGLLQCGRVSSAARALTDRDRAYAFVPMTHIFGLGTVLTASLTGGASLVLRGGFSPDDLLQSLVHDGVSNLQGPPTMYARLLAHIEANALAPAFPHLRYVYTGSAPLDIALKQSVEALFRQPLHFGSACPNTPVRSSSRDGRKRGRTPRGATWSTARRRALRGPPAPRRAPARWARSGCAAPG